MPRQHPLAAKLREAELAALQAEDVHPVDDNGNIVVELPWAPLLRRLREGWIDPGEMKHGNRDYKLKNHNNPPTITLAKAEMIVRMIARGNYHQTACFVTGVPHNTFIDWGKKAKEGRQPYALLFELVREAEYIAESRYMAIIERAAIEDWRAAAWYLERRHPERWDRARMGNGPALFNKSDPRLSSKGAAQLEAHVDGQSTTVELLPPLPDFDEDA